MLNYWYKAKQDHVFRRSWSFQRVVLSMDFVQDANVVVCLNKTNSKKEFY